MKKLIVAVLASGLIGLLAAQSASAHGRWHGHGGHSRGHANFGFYFGGPLYDPWYRPFPPPYYYEPRTVIIEREPPVYIQREPAQPPMQQPPAQAAAPLWYYCPNPAGYYPHVPTCNQQWIPVDPSTLPPR